MIRSISEIILYSTSWAIAIAILNYDVYFHDVKRVNSSQLIDVGVNV